ncbi:MAG: thiamine-phosphate kinase [Gammaproteobacteria bacterium]
MSEFTIIKEYFQRSIQHDQDVILGIGDDAAVVNIPENQQLVVCVDTIVAGRHFLLDTPADAIGHRALAVNLSDIAAMGATPRWFTLALTIPDENVHWLREFSQGLWALAKKYRVELIGGDTTQGPLAITIQVLGTIAPQTVLTRSGAQVGDKIYVTGSLGDAGLGLEISRGSLASIPGTTAYQTYLCRRYQYPEPRIEFGEKLVGIASSMIDVSDGLAADLSHILEQSQLGATIYSKDLPLSPALRNLVSIEQAQHYALTAGDDYELCFTVPAIKQQLIQTIVDSTGIACTCIGEIVAEQGLKILDKDGKLVRLEKMGWEFFASS